MSPPQRSLFPISPPVLAGRRIILGGLVATVVLVLPSAWAEDPAVTGAKPAAAGHSPVTTVAPAQEAIPPDPELVAYQALSASLSRNYDTTQDISPRQMVILLEVAERTGCSLGQALATGEHESARTWNDHVRPTLKRGNLGSAAGVWQFQPATFHGIVKRFGSQLLAAAGADATTDRQAMDLGEGPFTDTEVRNLIQETVDSKRDAQDEELQLLRHNFAVLAFAKHYLSIDTGATTPEEDYLFHFLGETEGRRVLALARGEARDTLSVKPVEEPIPPLDTEPQAPEGGDLIASGKPEATRQARSLIVAERDLWLRVNPDAPPQLAPNRMPEIRLEIRPGQPAVDRTKAMMRAAVDRQPTPLAPLESTFVVPVIPAPPAASSEWGLPANSPTVTGNPGMFYRDGKGQTQPYTWGEFMDHLSQRVQARSQPAMVRAKYGVGFGLKGGDLLEWTFDPAKASNPVEFRLGGGQTVLLPEPMVTGPLSPNETARYKVRLSALVDQGDDQPLDILPPESLAALQHIGVLPPTVQDPRTTHPDVQKALQRFRKKVGKSEPDDPDHVKLLLPAERIALEVYDHRLTCFAELQTVQQASAVEAPDLKKVRTMPKGLQRRAAPHIAGVQWALADQGLLSQPTKKSVWRDKKGKKHVSYEKVPFTGQTDKATVAALNNFQWRKGLRKTDGVLDALTLELLGLPPLGPEMFLPLSGPQCPLNSGSMTDPLCETLADTPHIYDRLQIPRRVSRPTPIAY